MKKQAITIFAGLLLFGVLAGLIGRWSGEQLGQAHIHRLETVRPDVMTLPDGDRALILQAALKCGLERVAAAGLDSMASARVAQFQIKSWNEGVSFWAPSPCSGIQTA